MDDLVPTVALVALVKKFIDFAAYLRGREYGNAITQVVVWIAGVVAVLLYAQTTWADGIVFAGQTLADMNFASLVAVGLCVGYGFSVLTFLIFVF